MSCATPVTSMMVPISNASWRRTRSQKDRHQVDRGRTGRHAETEAQAATDREGTPPQCRRAARPDVPTRSERRTNSADTGRAPQQQRNAGRRQPTAVRRLHQADHRGRPAPPQTARARYRSSVGKLAGIGLLPRQQQRRHGGCDHAGNAVDQEQKRPRPVVRDPAADDGPGRRRQHWRQRRRWWWRPREAAPETAGTPLKIPRGSARPRKTCATPASQATRPVVPLKAQPTDASVERRDCLQQAAPTGSARA